MMIEIRKPLTIDEAVELAIRCMEELEKINVILDDVRKELEEKYGTTN